MKGRLTAAAFAVVFAVLGVVAALAPGLPHALRIAFAILAVLLSPGYALILALWPNRVLSVEVRCALTLGGSLAVAVLVGLAAAALPWGLRPAPASIELAFVTVALLAIAVVRIDIRHRLVCRLWKLRPLDVALLAASIAVAVTAVIVAARGANKAAATTSFTQLSIEPSADSPREVVINIRSFGENGSTFSLRVVQATTGATVAVVSDIRVSNGQKIDERISLPAGVQRPDLRADLYRSGDPTAYRMVGVS